MKKICLIVISIILLSGTYYITQSDNINVVQRGKQRPGRMANQSINPGNITEDQAKVLIQNYINQNPSFNYKITGYASFTNARRPNQGNSYVFELESNKSKYMIYITPTGILLGPSLVKTTQ